MQVNLQFIAVEKRSRQRGLDVLHSLRLKLILGTKTLRRLPKHTINTHV
jgi:hypothetical protein